MGNFCSKCGTAIRNDDGYCSNCGYQLKKDKKRVTAGMLGLFLGPLGIHNFYLGDKKKGIMQIVITLCSSGAAGIVGIVEGILILTGIINVENN